MFRLRIDGGPRNGEGISLAPGKALVIGRGRECDIRFPEDATMSRVQAELTWDGSAWSLVNKSQHGTLVSGQRVDTTKVLTPGDQLVLGGTRVVYEADPSGQPTMAPRPAAPAAGAAAAAGTTGSTPAPMPREAVKEAAAAAAGKPADGKAAAGKPGTPAAPGAKKKSNMMLIVIVLALFGCCCFSGLGYFVALPWWVNRHGAKLGK